MSAEITVLRDGVRNCISRSIFLPEARVGQVQVRPPVHVVMFHSCGCTVLAKGSDVNLGDEDVHRHHLVRPLLSVLEAGVQNYVVDWPLLSPAHHM